MVEWKKLKPTICFEVRRVKDLRTLQHSTLPYDNYMLVVWVSDRGLVARWQ